MRDLFKNLKSGIVIGISFFITITICSIAYGTINSIWTSPSNLEAIPGSTLTSDSWNNILQNQEFLKNNKQDNVSGLTTTSWNNILSNVNNKQDKISGLTTTSWDSILSNVNNKQNKLSGSGFVKVNGDTITYQDISAGGGFVGINYANETQVINVSGYHSVSGTWTANKNGYIRCTGVNGSSPLNMSIDGKQIYLLNYESAIVYTNTTQQEANTNGSVIFSPLYPISINQNLVATSGLSQSISCYFYPVL